MADEPDTDTHEEHAVEWVELKAGEPYTCPASGQALFLLLIVAALLYTHCSGYSQPSRATLGSCLHRCLVNSRLSSSSMFLMPMAICSMGQRTTNCRRPLRSSVYLFCV